MIGNTKTNKTIKKLITPLMMDEQASAKVSLCTFILLLFESKSKPPFSSLNIK